MSAVAEATRRLPALVAYVPRACLPAKRLAILALPCLTILASGLLAHTVSGRPPVAFGDVADPLVFGLAMPLGTLVILSLIHISEPTRPY